MNQNLSKEQRREQFLIENYAHWNERGQQFRKRREQHGLSLSRVADLLGTSASRVRRFEIGEPISLAKHLEKSYALLLDHLELHADLLELGEKHKFGGRSLRWRHLNHK